MKTICILIPVYNEEQVLPLLEKRLFPMCGLYWLLAALILSFVQKKWILFASGILFWFLGVRQAQLRLSSMTHPENDNWKKVIPSFSIPTAGSGSIFLSGKSMASMV